MIYSIVFPSLAAYSIDFYSKNESPFGKPYDLWVADWWNWTASIPFDPVASQLAGLKENGCLVNEDQSVIMLVDTAISKTINQVCKVPAGWGILVPIWTGECDNGKVQ
jgi:hypothetical protein